MIKKIIFGMIVSLIIIVTSSTVFASQTQGIEASLLSSSDFGLGNLDNYIGTNATSGTLKLKANNILGIIQTIGVVVSVVMLMAIGIKYMLGSVEEKAEYKASLKPYIIGAFLLFTGTTIPNIIFTIMQSI